MRIQSFTEFWPFYLSQHSNLYCRVLHFLGTTAFFMTMLYCFLINGWAIVIGLTVTAITTAIFFKREAKTNASGILFINIAALLIADWWCIFGIVFAYLCAWTGHFLLEKNRPATFSYPLWSFVGDFRMWFGMCLGKHWTTDNSTN